MSQNVLRAAERSLGTRNLGVMTEPGKTSFENSGRMADDPGVVRSDLSENYAELVRLSRSRGNRAAQVEASSPLPAEPHGVDMRHSWMPKAGSASLCRSRRMVAFYDTKSAVIQQCAPLGVG